MQTERFPGLLQHAETSLLACPPCTNSSPSATAFGMKTTLTPRGTQTCPSHCDFPWVWRRWPEAQVTALRCCTWWSCSASAGFSQGSERSAELSTAPLWRSEERKLPARSSAAAVPALPAAGSSRSRLRGSTSQSHRQQDVRCEV